MSRQRGACRCSILNYVPIEGSVGLAISAGSAQARTRRNDPLGGAVSQEPRGSLNLYHQAVELVMAGNAKSTPALADKWLEV